MSCTQCQKPNPTLVCSCCQAPVCKNCAEFLEEGQFSFMAQIPAEISGSIFCGNCFTEKVVPALNNYNETMEKARDIMVYTKSQGKETRFIRRTEKPVRVEKCNDYQETLMRLAFFAVQAGHNAIIDVDIRSEKIKIDGYQSTLWSGSGVPATVQSRQIPKDRSLWQNPN